MKRALAILFSLLLTVTQGALPLSAHAADDSAACSSCGCHCKTVSCCPPSSVPQSQPASAAPQSGKSHRDVQSLPVSTPLLLYIQLSSPSQLVDPSSVVFQATCVPLYERNCSYLI